MTSKESMLLLENQICFPLYAASRLTTKLYAPLLEKLDITYPQYLAMLVLWEKDHQTVSKISELLMLETNTLTPLLKRLEQKTLIKRLRSEEDERKVIISLTPKGQALRKEAECIPQQIMEQFRANKEDQNDALILKSMLDQVVAVLAKNANK